MPYLFVLCFPRTVQNKSSAICMRITSQSNSLQVSDVSYLSFNRLEYVRLASDWSGLRLFTPWIRQQGTDPGTSPYVIFADRPPSVEAAEWRSSQIEVSGI